MLPRTPRSSSRLHLSRAEQLSTPSLLLAKAQFYTTHRLGRAAQVRSNQAPGNFRIGQYGRAAFGKFIIKGELRARRGVSLLAAHKHCHIIVRAGLSAQLQVTPNHTIRISKRGEQFRGPLWAFL